MSKHRYGRTFDDRGRLRYWSASSLMLGDMSGGEGCLAKWFFEKIEGKKPEGTKAQAIGTQVHAEIEQYLVTGVDALGTLAARGKHMLPEPGPDLLVEYDIVRSLDIEMIARDAEMEGRFGEAEKIRAQVRLEDAPLKLLDIPVIGFIDLVHARGTNQGTNDVLDAFDPAGTIELVDHKTTKSPQYIKSAGQMARTIQMTTYARWALTEVPEAPAVRVSHNYFITQGSAAPRKVSLRLLPSDVATQWRHVEKVAADLLETSQMKKVADVRGNREACGAFGGCPHRSYCPHGGQTGMTRVFGDRNKTRNKMTSKLSLLKNKKSEFSAAEIAAEKARLAREEAQAKFPQLEVQWRELQDLGVGTPSTGGELAGALTDLGFDIAPSGDLAVFGPFDDVELVPDLIAEARAMVVPKMEPEAAPAKATSVALSAHERAEQAEGLHAPDAAEIRAEADKDEPPTKARRRGRPPGAKNKVKEEMPETSIHAAAVNDEIEIHHDVVTPTYESNVVDPNYGRPITEIPVVEGDSARRVTPLVLIINARVDGGAPSLSSFNDRLDHLLAAFATDAGLPHIALAGGNHELGFGKWKYALAVELAKVELSEGLHVYNTAGGELAQVVIDAMTQNVLKAGGIVIRGSV